MGYLLYFLVIVLAFLKPRNRVVTVLLYTFLVLIFGLNNHHLSDITNHDFINYFTMYDIESYNSERSVEIGFRWIIVQLNSYGFNFNTFRIFIGLIGYYLILDTLKLYTKWNNYVLLLYLIYPFINDVIQIRNFLSMSIVIFSTRYIFFKKKYSDVKFISLIVLASTIHITSVFYVFFLVVKKIHTDYLFKYVLVLTGILTTLAYTGGFKYIAGLVTTNPKVFHYLSRQTTWGMIIVLFLIFMYFYVYYLMHHRVKKCFLNTDSTSEYISFKFEYLDILFKFNVICLLLIPLLTYDLNYLRIYRNILFLNYIVFIDAIMYSRGNVKIKYALIASTFTIFMFVFYYLMNYENQIISVLSDNYLF